MKINSITNSMTPPGRERIPLRHKSAGECVHNMSTAGKKYGQNNYGNINTSIKRNPDARVSFKGDISKLKEPLLHKASNFAKNNPIAADALFILPVTCLLKPYTYKVLSKSKNEKDKDKYHYQAAKAVASGLAGFGMALAVGTIVKKGVDHAKNAKVFKMPDDMKKKSLEIIKTGVAALKETAQKLTQKGENTELAQQIQKVTADDKINLYLFNNEYEKLDHKAVKSFTDKIEKISPETAAKTSAAIEEQKAVDNYSSAAKNAADKMFQPVFLPLRAKITFLSIPFILKKIGFKKPSRKPEEPQYPMLYAGVFKGLNHEKNTKEIFQPFMGSSK